MRIKIAAWTFAAALALAAAAAAADDRGKDPGGFVIHPDGSVEAGGLTFRDLVEFQLSDEFRRGGYRCGAPERDELVELVTAAKSPTHCSLTSTTIDAEYDPVNGPVHRIPVVFHVISRSYGTGKLSNSLIASQIEVLNEDFRALAGSPGAPGVDSRIEFYLATTDPYGNPTTGIERVTSNAWFNDPGPGAFNAMKNALRWDTTRYLNIYTNNAAGLLGYATFPQQDAGSSPDGVVLNYITVGRNNPNGGIYDLGRTATHEIGHYLGLFHTFQGGCGSATAPYTTGDLIADTARQQSPNYFCPAGAASCGSLDPIENYLNYTQDDCMDRFTAEQTNRMRCAIANYREALVAGGGSGPAALENGVPVSGLSGAFGSERRYTLQVPAGARDLVIRIAGGSGDADLYVRHGAPPNPSAWDCRPFRADNYEDCVFTTPGAGTWHILVHAFAAYSGLTLSASYATGPAMPEYYTGTLAGTGDVHYFPYYCVPSEAGVHTGWLEGPATADFDLQLWIWPGHWIMVAESNGTTSSEAITYFGEAGCYSWRVVSYSGSGGYDLWLIRP